MFFHFFISISLKRCVTEQPPVTCLIPPVLMCVNMCMSLMLQTVDTQPVLHGNGLTAAGELAETGEMKAIYDPASWEASFKITISSK